MLRPLPVTAWSCRHLCCFHRPPGVSPQMPYPCADSAALPAAVPPSSRDRPDRASFLAATRDEASSRLWRRCIRRQIPLAADTNRDRTHKSPFVGLFVSAAPRVLPRLSMPPGLCYNALSVSVGAKGNRPVARAPGYRPCEWYRRAHRKSNGFGRTSRRGPLDFVAFRRGCGVACSSSDVHSLAWFHAGCLSGRP